MDDGIAVNATGYLYVTDEQRGVVDIFAPNAVVPKIAYRSPNNPGQTSGTLNATVDPNGGGEVTQCKFEYTSEENFNSNHANEIQTLTPSGATGGTFRLGFEGQSTDATGSGELTSGDATITGLSTSTGAFGIGEEVTGEGIPPGTTITGVEAEFGRLHLSAAVTQTKAAVALTAPGLSYDASAELVQSALESLSTINQEDVAVSGPPGGPYMIEFTGARAATDVPQLTADSSGLTPPGSTATIATSRNGGDGWGTAHTVPCESPSSLPYASETQVHADLTGLTPETTYHYRLLLANANATRKQPEQAFTPHAVIGLETEAATDVGPHIATINGSFQGNGEETHYYLEWGTSKAYGHKTPLEDAGSPPNGEHVSESLDLTGLPLITGYHYRIVAHNSVGTSFGSDQQFTTTAAVPLIEESLGEVHSESAVLHAQVNPQGAGTTFHFEYGTAPCSGEPDPCTAQPDINAGASISFQSATLPLTGLTPGTTYHYRVVATNQLSPPGGSLGPERTFTTFSYSPILNDPCPNAHVRQQTGAALLLDCRAYELVSAANAGGYNVESDLVPGGAPYGGFPEAENPPRVLYGVHDGGIPGTDHPTDRGLDPYVATRGAVGWSTEYVGVPANDPFAAAPFSSTPSAAGAGLEAFAFGASGGCSPCFAGGYTGIPVRFDGSLIQGMVPAPGFEPGPTATPDGYVAADLSANGEHLIFGSTARFAEGGNDETGDVSIYDHNLKTGATHVVSNAPTTEDFPVPLPCLQGAGNCNSPTDNNGISELDVSANGSHILIGQKVATDADGNTYWHLYMDVNDGISSIDLTPGAGDGVLFDGMSADGSKVFFTTADQLAGGGDTDSSADIYQATISGQSATLTRISTGEGAGNSNACEPVANKNGEHWNTVGSSKDCGAVAIGGGGGVAAESGSLYFLSPEKLSEPAAACGIPCAGEEPLQNQPNLYLAAPGSPPHFIATLSPEDPLVLDALKSAEIRKTADFEITPSGRFAAFTSTLALREGLDNAGHAEVYRYDASTEKLDCASCNPTNASASADSSMASDGLSLTDDGRVFFDSKDALVPRDLDNKEDVYEWEPIGAGPEKAPCVESSPSFDTTSPGCLALISAGSSPFASSLLSAGAGGTDVYFFTNDSLASQDQNGPITKIYDARQEGGFPYTPPQPLCAASDECHGASSPIPGPAEIRTLESGPGNVPVEESEKCKKGFAFKHGKCVKRPRPHRHKHHKRGR